MKTEEIKKLIQKVGPLRLGAVVICGILLILISYGVSFEKAGGSHCVGQRVGGGGD